MGNKIDKVYIFTTLPRAADRALICFGGLLAKEVPAEKIEIFDGPDHEDFPSQQAIKEAAAADGYPGFLEGGGSHFGIAQNWAYCKMFDQIRDRSETAIILHDDNYLRLSFYRYEQIVNQIPDFAYMALGGGTSINEWPHFPHEAPLVLKGVPFEMNDQCAIVTPQFVEWLRSYFPDRTDYKSFEGFMRSYAIPNKKLPEGCYTMPGELSSRTFPDTIIPSIAHDTVLWREQGIFKALRPDDK